LIISHSEVESFQACKRKHYYAFGEKIEKKVHSVALQRGADGHEIFNQFFTKLSDSTFDKALDTIPVAASKLFTIQNSESIMQVTQLITEFVSKNRDRVSKWSVVAIEKEFRIQMDEYTYAFRPDLVIEESGKKTLIDYKFPYDFYIDDVANLLPQIPRYVGALRVLGENVHGGAYIFLRTRKITDPAKQRVKFYPITLGNTRVVNAIKDLDIVAKEIVSLKNSGKENWESKATRSANGMTCKNCQFLEVCSVENSGEDSSLVRRMSYKQSTYGYKETEE
jgi:CRISPR/Cas system-associated exonuclease Cas4 (RecB family)